MSAIKRLKCLTINRCFKMNKWGAFPFSNRCCNCRRKTENVKTRKTQCFSSIFFYFILCLSLRSFFFFLLFYKNYFMFHAHVPVVCVHSWTTKLFPFGIFVVWKSNRNVLSKIKVEFSGCNRKINVGTGAKTN